MQFNKSTLDDTFEAHPYEKQLEMVLAVDKAELFYLLPARAQGIIATNISELLTDLRWHLHWLPRRTAEESNSLIHFIPYGPITRTLESGDIEVATYQRPSKNNGEKLLAGMSSIGWAGHPDFLDSVFDKRGVVTAVDTCTEAFFREIAEEAEFTLDGQVVEPLTHPHLFKIATRGVLLDRSDKVGQVHLGLIYLIHLNDPRIQISAKNPAEIVNPKFERLEDVCGQMADRNFENWSKIILEDMADQWNRAVDAENQAEMEELSAPTVSNEHVFTASKDDGFDTSDREELFERSVSFWNTHYAKLGYVMDATTLKEALAGDLSTFKVFRFSCHTLKTTQGEYMNYTVKFDNFGCSWSQPVSEPNSVIVTKHQGQELENTRELRIDNLDVDPMTLDSVELLCHNLFEDHYSDLGVVFDTEGVRKALEGGPTTYKQLTFRIGTYQTPEGKRVAYGLSFDDVGVSWDQPASGPTQP